MKDDLTTQGGQMKHFILYFKQIGAYNFKKIADVPGGVCATEDARNPRPSLTALPSAGVSSEVSSWLWPQSPARRSPVEV